MTSIYLIRHAQSEGNLSRRFQGRLDAPLTELGMKQAGALVRRFAAIPLHAVYASPLSRAVQTAQALAAPRNLNLTTDPALMEMDAGAMENMPFSTLVEQYSQQLHRFDLEPHLFEGFEGAESIFSVYERVTNAIDGIAARHKNQNVAIVSHGLPIRCYLCHAGAGSIEQLGQTIWSKNTGVSHIIHHNGKIVVMSENGLSHLEDDLTGLEWRLNP